MKRTRLTGIQYAALPYQHHAGKLSILLISSRRSRRWIIPRGWPIEGLKPHEAAAVEAHEEAGVEGAIADHPLGSYSYVKEIKDGQSMAMQVIVFPLAVTGRAEAFKEMGQRHARWFHYRRAAALVAEPALRGLILDFGEAQSTSYIVRSLRRYRAWRLRRREGELQI